GVLEETPSYIPIEKRRATRPLDFVALLQPCNDAEIFQRCRVASDFAVRGQLPKQATHDFAAASLGQHFGEADIVRLSQRANFFRDPLAQLFFELGTGSSSVLERDERGNGLTFKLMGTPYPRGLGHGFMRHQR